MEKVVSDNLSVSHEKLSDQIEEKLKRAETLKVAGVILTSLKSVFFIKLFFLLLQRSAKKISCFFCHSVNKHTG